jgi:predicted MFS family arabinose efflux permease
MERVFIIQAITLIALSFVFAMPWLGLVCLFCLGMTMYLLNSPMQMFYLAVAEQDYPQSMVLASSLISIFNNVGIAVGSAAGGGIVTHFGLNWLGLGGGIFTVVALMTLLLLNRVRRQMGTE